MTWRALFIGPYAPERVAALETRLESLVRPELVAALESNNSIAAEQLRHVLKATGQGVTLIHCSAQT